MAWWRKLAALVATAVAAGCAGGGGGLVLARPDPAALPAPVRAWVEEHSRRAGAHVRHEGDRTFILVAWGEKPTGGYTVRVEEVVRGREAEVAVVRLEAPAPGQVVTQAISYPYDLVAVPRLRRPLVFAYRGGFTPAGPPLSPGPAAGAPAAAAESENFRVTAPAPGSVIASPVRVTGFARVFEGAFELEIEDGHNVLARTPVTAAAGAPAWGGFDLVIPFAPPTSPAGAIIFVTYSPADGSRREELVLPVRFAP